MKRTVVWGGDPNLEALMKDARPRLLHVLLTSPADRRRVEESLGGSRIRCGVRSVFYHDVADSTDATRVAASLERKVRHHPGSSLELAIANAPGWLCTPFIETAQASPKVRQLEPLGA